jgi:hypothetical protein
MNHSPGESRPSKQGKQQQLSIEVLVILIYKILLNCHHRSKYTQWTRIDCRYQRGNQKLLIKEGHKIQWPREKGQKDKQWSTTHYTENLALSYMKLTGVPEV